MGFFEDDRIRRKNLAYNDKSAVKQDAEQGILKLSLHDISLRELITTLKNSGLSVTLVKGDTIEIGK